MKILIKLISLMCLTLVLTTQEIFTIGKDDYNKQLTLNNDDELALAVQMSLDTESKEEQETKTETESATSKHNRLLTIINSLQSRKSHSEDLSLRQEYIKLVTNALTGDVNQKNSKGETALMYAAWNDYTDIVHLLLEKGANLDLQTNAGSTALDIAIDKNNENTVKILLKAGANPNIQSKIEVRTPLILASAFGLENIVEILLNANADVNVKDKDGFTALMWAAEKGQADIVTLLINARADLNLKNKHGETAMNIPGISDDIKKMLEDTQLQRKLEPHIRRSVRKKIIDTEVLPPELADIVSEYAVCTKQAKKEKLK